jgi:hypothetical protein
VTVKLKGKHQHNAYPEKSEEMQACHRSQKRTKPRRRNTKKKRENKNPQNNESHNKPFFTST